MKSIKLRKDNCLFYKMRNDFYSVNDTAEHIRRAQYLLRAIGRSDGRIPAVFIDGVYGAETQNAVTLFQEYYELPITGELDAITFDAIFREYSLLAEISAPVGFAPDFQYYESGLISPGDVFDDVYLIQLLFRKLSVKDDRFFIEITGAFDEQTENAVKLLQQISSQPQSGSVDPALWNTLVKLSLNTQGYL